MRKNEREAEFKELYRMAVNHAADKKEVEAELAFARAAAHAPDLWCDLAVKLAKEGQEDMAMDHFKTALQVTPLAGIRSGIFTNVANIYAKRGQLTEAQQMLDQALQEDAQNVDALVNLGMVSKWQGRPAESDRYCTRALAINPWHGEAQFLQALNVLDRGDYERGFPLYECRWRSRTNGLRKVECFQPEWAGPAMKEFLGRPIKRLFIYGEQGAGDVFLMLRYAPLIRALGLWQHWCVKSGMTRLVSGLVDSCSETGAPPDEFDAHIPSASLPFVFGTTMQTIPPTGYLSIPPEDKFNYGPGFNVGIAWRGNKGQFNDAVRSSSLADWQPILDVPGVRFHSLQVDGEDEALFYPRIEQHNAPKDWYETARRLAGLDLLISVDTGIVHLAGAMNLPVWCALHARPYFVFPVSQSGTPWYPSVRLFKQKQAFEWGPVFEQIAAELTTEALRC